MTLLNSTTSASISAINNIFSTPSLNFKNLISLLNNNVLQIILSAFFGGFFAGWFANFFESRRRVSEKRTDKYYEHRNTVVQIEHELIPVRVNMSRNIASINEAIESTNQNNIRLILRFYKLDFSTGLSLRLLNLDLINMYSETYSLLQSINADFEYIGNIISLIGDEINKNGKPDMNKLSMYVTFIIYLKDVCEKADKKTLELLSFCQCAIAIDEIKMKNLYIKNGGQINYKISKENLTKKSKETEKQENLPYKDGETRPKFVTPYLDIKKVIINGR